MKQFVHQSLELLGATVCESADDALAVNVEAGSTLVSLFDSPGIHHLTFSRHSTEPVTLPVFENSPFLEGLHNLLAVHSTRHGRLPEKIILSRKSLRDDYRIFTGKITRFSCRGGWETTVYCHVKATITGEEQKEELITVKVPFRGDPVVQPDGFVQTDSVCPHDCPPLKRYQFLNMVESGLQAAEQAVLERAEELRRESLKRLYDNLTRLKTYYGQVVQEAKGKKEKNRAASAEKVYQLRKTEEVQQATVRIELTLVAAESVAVPVKNLTWTVENGKHCRKISAVFNCFDGTRTGLNACEICGRKANELGLTVMNQMACPGCYASCDNCATDIVGPDAAGQSRCGICGKHFCEAHAMICSHCGRRICLEHGSSCAFGCRVCPACAFSCPECSPEIVWCRDHSLQNSKGDVICRPHAVHCIGCREPFPSGCARSCAHCGQTICEDCNTACHVCGQRFCLNHIDRSLCVTCRDHQKEGIPWQRKMF